jgi:hypothetical protein
MVRPPSESRFRKKLVDYLRTGRTSRVAAIYLALAIGGPTKRFKEIWDTPIVREIVRNKSVLHDTIEYMRRRKMVDVKTVSRKLTRVTLLMKPPEIVSHEANRILAGVAPAEDAAKRAASNIESRKISEEEADKFVRGMFLQSEAERLEAIVKLLPVFRNPVLWPHLWWDLMQSLVVLPMIFQLHILRACEDVYPSATRSALAAWATSISNLLKSERFREYHATWELLTERSSSAA